MYFVRQKKLMRHINYDANADGKARQKKNVEESTHKPHSQINKNSKIHILYKYNVHVPHPFNNEYLYRPVRPVVLVSLLSLFVGAFFFVCFV